MPREQKKYHYLYKTTNLINNKFYVGIHSTVNLEDGYIGSGTLLRRAIRRYGKNNFKFEIIQFFKSREELLIKEKEIVNEEILKNNQCMNLKPGGGGGFCNEEHRNKFIEASKKTQFKTNDKGTEKFKYLYQNDDTWKKWFISRCKPYDWTGKKHSEDTKKKIGKINSINQKKEKNSQFGTCWITDGVNNKKINKDLTIPEGWYKGRIIKN